jgi:hypothetical protein
MATAAPTAKSPALILDPLELDDEDIENYLLCFGINPETQEPFD